MFYSRVTSNFCSGYSGVGSRAYHVPLTSKLEQCKKQLKEGGDKQLIFEAIHKEVLRMEAIMNNEDENKRFQEMNKDVDVVKYYVSYQTNGDLKERSITFPDKTEFRIECPFQFFNSYSINDKKELASQHATVPLTKCLDDCQQRLKLYPELKDIIFKIIVSEIESIEREMEQDYTKFQLKYEGIEHVKYEMDTYLDSDFNDMMKITIDFPCGQFKHNQSRMQKQKKTPNNKVIIVEEGAVVGGSINMKYCESEISIKF